MTRPDWAPGEIDTERPTAARIYDYFLGGSHNFAADRRLADEVITNVPDSPAIARSNRAFLRRAVNYCVRQGIDQFLDIGSGIPTLGNVHEVAQQANPAARVVYVDMDPVAVEHSRAILAGNERATVIRENFLAPGAILENKELREVLDLERPVALLLVALVHFVGRAQHPEQIIAMLRDAMAPGSLLVLSHGTSDGQENFVTETIGLYRRTATPGQPLGKAEIEGLFAGYELVEPGVTWAPLWRPDEPSPFDEDPRRSSIYVGGGRKPA